MKDIIFFDDAYRDVYRRAGLEVVAEHRPLGREDEPFAWVNETTDRALGDLRAPGRRNSE